MITLPWKKSKNMEKIEKRIITNQACISGAILGAIVIICTLISALLVKIELGSIAKFFVDAILWITKFAGCILVMMFFMKKLCREWSDVQNSDTFRLGLLSALFSALLIGIFIYIYYTFIVDSEFLSAQINQTLGNFSSMMDSNSRQKLEQMMEGNTIAVISMISNTIYCFIYGIVLSAIMSRSIPSRNPFANSDEEE